MSVIDQIANLLSQFLYALKAPETKRQWPNRLKVVFDFLGLDGNLDEQAKEFMTLCKEGGTTLVQDKIIGFISSQVHSVLKALSLPLSLIRQSRPLTDPLVHFSGRFQFDQYSY
jgi:hypothetical protein